MLRASVTQRLPSCPPELNRFKPCCEWTGAPEQLSGCVDTPDRRRFATERTMSSEGARRTYLPPPEFRARPNRFAHDQKSSVETHRSYSESTAVDEPRPPISVQVTVRAASVAPDKLALVFNDSGFQPPMAIGLH
jgi:hypothetical protein